MGIARSDTASWNSTYTVDADMIPQFRSTNSTKKEYIGGEDDFIWIDKVTDTYHILFHSMDGTCSDPGGSYTMDNEAGCHAFSADG
jgi:hypothetical protein